MERTFVTPGPEGLKALAHPGRLRMLGLLRTEGPATATTLAARLGLNSGATSYHLRQLEKHGFVVEDVERGDARDRWWRAAHQSTHVGHTGGGETLEEQDAHDAFLQSVAVVYTAKLQRSLAESRSLPEAWQEAGDLSDWNPRVTPARARALVQALHAVVEGWAEEPDDPDARSFTVNLNAYLTQVRSTRPPVTSPAVTSPAVMSRRSPLWGYLTAQAISVTGTRITMIAIPWFVLTTTGSATLTGLVAFAEMAPLVMLQALSGPLIDRLGARRVAISCDLASVVVVGLIPALHVLGLLHLPVLLVMVALTGALRGPGEVAKHAMMPALVEVVALPTERVTGLEGAVSRTASLTGAAVAGALVALVGGADALVVDAGSFLVSGLLLLVTTHGLPEPGPASRPDLGYRAQLRAGWDFMRRDPVLIGIGVMVAVTNLLDQGYSAVLLPVWARESGNGVAAVGLVSAVFGAGALLGSVLAASLAHRLPRFATFLAAFLIAGAPRYAALALGLPLPAVAAVAVVSGLGAGFLNPILGAVLFERTPKELIGRVSAMNIAMSWSLIPFGGLLGGVLIAGVGLSPALLMFGAAYFATTLLPAVQPRWRELDDRTPVALRVEADQPTA